MDYLEVCCLDSKHLEIFQLSAAAAKSLQSCPTVRPHRRQPTRLPHPWDSPGKNTGVGCHFLLQCLKVKSEREVAQSCLTLSDLMDYSLPGSSIHGIFQARVLAWITFSSKFNHHVYLDSSETFVSDPVLLLWPLVCTLPLKTVASCHT